MVRANDKVLRPVVELVLIYMMDFRARGQWMPQGALYHQLVFKLATTFGAMDPVAIAGHAAGECALI